MAKVKTPRWAWALTGSGHFLKECLRMLRELDDVDLFRQQGRKRSRAHVSAGIQIAAGHATFPRYDRERRASRLILLRHLSHADPRAGDLEYSSKLCGGHFRYPRHQRFAQAGKCRLPAIVFACDTAPELETEAPKGMVKVYPREIDLKNTERLKSFESTVVVESLEDLKTALGRRRRELHG
jgi:dihydromethanopterin reductase (acceptor)